MNYVVLDLEWNQSNTGQEDETAKIPFEIIEIGAVKLNDTFDMINEFSQLVKPEVYRVMHQYTGRLIHLQMEELECGRSFKEVAENFLEWCGSEEYIFCVWGSQDLTEFQRNMKFYDMENLSQGPIAFLDVQKLFSIAFEDGKSRRSLEGAVDMMQMEKDIPFHRAFSDAYYTANLLKLIAEKDFAVLKRVSFDLYHPPSCREQEVRIQFDTYMKYISREFEDKAAAFSDKEVSSSKCYLCHKNLRKKVKWFSPNGRHYYCLAWCDRHGYLKGKIRIHKSEAGKVYVVKITKLIAEEEAAKLKERSAHLKKLQKRRP